MIQKLCNSTFINAIYEAWQQCNIARLGEKLPSSLESIITEMHDGTLASFPNISQSDLQKNIVENFCSLLAGDISDAAIAAGSQVGI